MTLFHKNRSPSTFPVKYADLVARAKEALGTELFLTSCNTRTKAEQEAERFRAWRHALRNFPAFHRSQEIERDYRIRTAIRQAGHRWDVLIRVEPRTDLAPLNPHLADILG